MREKERAEIGEIVKIRGFEDSTQTEFWVVWDKERAEFGEICGFEDFELRLTFEFQRKETADFGEICKIRGFEDSELRPIAQTKFWVLWDKERAVWEDL